MNQAEVWMESVEGTCASADNGVAEPVMKTKERRKERERESGKREAELEEIEPVAARREWHLHHQYLDSDHL